MSGCWCGTGICFDGFAEAGRREGRNYGARAVKNIPGVVPAACEKERLDKCQIHQRCGGGDGSSEALLRSYFCKVGDCIRSRYGEILNQVDSSPPSWRHYCNPGLLLRRVVALSARWCFRPNGRRCARIL